MAKKQQNKTFGISVIKNSAIIPQPTKEYKTSFAVNDWWRFGVNNLFPNEIAFLNRTSPAHGGILDSKKTFCSGSEISFENITDKFLQMFWERTNNEGCGLWDLSGKFFASWFEGGNIFIEIVTNRKRNYLNLFIHDFTTCRLGRGKKEGNVLLYPDWERVAIGGYDIEEIPLYPNFIEKDGNLHSMLMLKRDVAGFPRYGLPRWLSSLDSVEIGKGVNVWNKMRVKTGFSSDSILELECDSPEQAAEVDKKFNEKKRGEENAGNMIVIKRAVGGTSPANLIQLNRTSEGEFLTLQKMSIDDIVMAHGWFRSLCSLPDNTGFDTQRIINEYDIAKATVILPTQNFFIETMEKIFMEVMNIDISYQIQFINKPPVKNTKVWKIWELRQAEGLAFDEKDPAQQEYVGETKKAETK